MERAAVGRLTKDAECNASECQAGLDEHDADADPPFLGEGCQRPGTPIGLATNESSVVAAQRMSGGMRAKGAYEQHRKLCRWRARAHLEPASASLGLQGGGEARSTGEAG